MNTNKRPSIKLLCYRHKQLSDGTHPVMLQVIHEGMVKRFSLGYTCGITQWNDEGQRFTSKMPRHREANAVLLAIQQRAENIVDDMLRAGGAFTFSEFTRQFRGNNEKADVIAYFEKQVQTLREQDRAGTALAYGDALNALRRFTGGKRLPFAEISMDLLNDWERDLRAHGCSAGGIGAYMRAFRAVLNKAVGQKLLVADQYPFSTAGNKGGYSLKHLRSEHNPRAMSEADIECFKAFPFSEHPTLATSVRLFLFSYYARGMNFADMAHMKWADMQNGKLRYTRKKTGAQHTIPVQNGIADLLSHLGRKDSPYVLPILGEKHQTAASRKNRIRKVIKQVNADLKAAALVLGMDHVPTTYTARHTYANRLKEQRVPVQVISEGLGHKSLTTTRSYLKRFGDEVLEEADALL